MPARRAVNLTDSAVRKTPPPQGKERVYLWDSQVPGYFVRLGPDGRGRHGVTYRDAMNRQRWMTIPGGHWPALTVAKGREAARLLLARLADGKDPAADRDRARAGKTVAEAWEAYLAAQEAHWRPSTRAQKAWFWGRCIAPIFGRTRLEAVTPAAVAKMHRDLGERGKTLANLSLVTLQALFGWLIAEELFAGSNPCARVRPFKIPPRERFLGMEETRVLFQAIALEEARAAGVLSGDAPEGIIPQAGERPESVGEEGEEGPGVSPAHATLFRLLAFTGCRKGEILRARWAWVDWERARLMLPEDASKTGARAVPLSGAALEELKQAWDRRAGNEWIIEGRFPDRPATNPHKPWQRVLRRANALANAQRRGEGLPVLEPGPFSGLRIHDLRHSWVSAAVELGVPLFVAGKAVGHRNESTSARYAHLADDPLARAHEAVAARIAAAVAGQGAKVQDITPTVPTAQEGRSPAQPRRKAGGSA